MKAIRVTTLLIILLVVLVVPVMAQEGVTAPVLRVNLTPHLISLATGAALSLLFAYFPKLNTWYAGLESTTKSIIMIGMLAATSVIIQGLGCLGVFSTGLACTADGWWMTLAYFGEALITNQPTYGVTKNLQTKGVKTALKVRSAPKPYVGNPDASPDLHATAGGSTRGK